MSMCITGQNLFLPVQFVFILLHGDREQSADFIYSMDVQIFQKSRSHLKIPGARNVIRGKFYPCDL